MKILSTFGDNFPQNVSQYTVRPTPCHRISGRISIQKEVTWDFYERRGFKIADLCSLELISHKVFLKSFCKSQLPNKSVNLFFILVIVKDKLTDLWGSCLFPNDFKNTLCEIRVGPGAWWWGANLSRGTVTSRHWSCPANHPLVLAPCLYTGTSLIRNTHPPRITIGP